VPPCSSEGAPGDDPNGVSLEAVEIRCDVHDRRLFGKLLVEQKALGEPAKVREGLMEFYCKDCTADARFDDPLVKRVLHRFDLLANLVETLVEKAEVHHRADTTVTARTA